MFLSQQLGFIVDVAKPKKNYYRLKLIDSGTVVVAVPLQQSRGASTRFRVGDHVKASFAGGAWFIDGLIPKIVLDENAAPRLKALAPGDAFLGNAETGAGFLSTGGLLSAEAGGIDGSGKPRRAASTAWVPDTDAIMNLCRRFGLSGAPGNMQMLHDDITGNAAFRMWMKSSSTPLLDGPTSRIHMGFHRDPIGATFSITTFPPGPDPTANLKEPDFKIDPEAEIHPFAGQWPLIERRDWQSRYYVLVDGTAIYENALVPVATITPTTPAQAMVRVIITPEGSITTTAKTAVSLNAVTNLITLKTGYTMAAGSFALIKAPLITLNGRVVRLGVSTDAIRLCNENFFSFFLNELITWLETHTHPVTGSVTGPPVISPPIPDSVTSITKNTKAS